MLNFLTNTCLGETYWKRKPEQNPKRVFEQKADLLFDCTWNHLRFSIYLKSQAASAESTNFVVSAINLIKGRVEHRRIFTQKVDLWTVEDLKIDCLSHWILAGELKAFFFRSLSLERKEIWSLSWLNIQLTSVLWFVRQHFRSILLTLAFLTRIILWATWVSLATRRRRDTHQFLSLFFRFFYLLRGFTSQGKNRY